MTGKTKAAMPGRQCNTALLKHRQITRLAAGGQTLHSPVLARSNYHQGFKIRAGVQNLRSPFGGAQIMMRQPQAICITQSGLRRI